MNKVNDSNLPDFIIIGAMKSGTTSVHHILAQHPEIYIPEREIFFFDIDDFQQHPMFFFYNKEKWIRPNYVKDFNKYLNWYKSFFRDAKKGQIIGEDTTGYLVSDKAPSRIHELLPDAKFVVILRDPASRAYSHYWHYLRAGRIFYQFEDALRLMPNNMIERSLYKKQIERYLQVFPKEQFFFIIFEEFIANKQKTMSDLCSFLGVSSDIDLAAIDTHYNRAAMPRNLKLKFLRNFLLRKKALRKYAERMPYFEDSLSNNEVGWFANFIGRFLSLINPHIPAKPPEMLPNTRHFLDEYFMYENDGLSKLINKDVNKYWYKTAAKTESAAKSSSTKLNDSN
ncbi:MAG: sulfotransferase [Planctomycetes bacterium]|nr:sulfotransferase [Planctomycetota bacterium]